MIVLGINEDHNATAALIKDGMVLFAASEERITRLKNDTGYPKKTIDEALRITGIKPSEIDAVAFSCQNSDVSNLRTKRITNFKVADYVREQHEHWKPILLEKRASLFWRDIVSEKRFQNISGNYYDFSFMERAPEKKWNELFRREQVRVVTKHLKLASGKIRFINHHLSHASYAYFASDINRQKKTAVLTGDGWGDGENGSIYLAENGVLKKIHGTPLCNMARVYRYITLLLGMRPFEHEYKVMGLAPYAKEYIKKPAHEVFKETLVVDGLDFRWKKKPSDLYFYFRDKLEGMRFDGIAAGVQQWVEDLLVEWGSNVMRHLKTDQLVYSGGLAMNVKANKSLAEIAEVKAFFVPANGGDESTAIGAAFAVAVEGGDMPQTLTNIYLGYAITNEEINKLLKKEKVHATYEVIEDASEKDIVALLVKNKIIARCVGAMEFGARALGNRSILCHPGRAENLRLLNEKVKYRDFWMPFTPSILDYRVDDYLINPKKLYAPHMTLAFDTTALGQEHLRAALHPSDLTARPQMLAEEANPSYYSLIRAFEKKTGIGALLNTSFNLHGEPIVRNSEDAWRTFVDSGLDALILNDTLIIKK